MRIVFGNWKYIIKNFLFILPFALLPAVFLALSLDQYAISEVLKNFFGGTPAQSFSLLFRTWSLIRIDSWLGLLYGVGVIVSVAVCMALMLSLVEKHMRIGKRTLSGAFTQLGNNLLTALAITLLYVALYELWSLITAAVTYSIGSLVEHADGAYVLMIFAFLVLFALLVYSASVFYLWFPCLQHTSFSFYEGFRYSYQLLLNVRVPLIVAFSAMLAAVYAFVALIASFLPPFLFYPIAFVVFVFIFLDFCIRMETVYFTADGLDREDLIRSYRGL